MKVYSFIVFTCLIFVACNKSASNDIYGRWQVINDSSIIRGASTSYNVYNGNDNDYFDFSSNGILYSKEKGVTDTFTYKLLSSNKINITQTGVLIDAITESGTYIFSGNEVKINITPTLINPGFLTKELLI